MGHARRSIVWGLVLCAVIGLATTGAAVAASRWLVSFEGTSTRVYTDDFGSTEYQNDAVITLDCTLDGCTYRPVEYAYSFGDGVIELAPGQSRADVAWDARGDPCDADYAPPGTISLVVTATEASVTGFVAGWEAECEPGTGTISTMADLTETLVAAWVEGDTCVIEGLACAGADVPGAPEQTAQPGTDGTAEGRADRATSSQLASGSPAAPSVLSALASPGQAGTAPAQVAASVLLTIILVLLVAFPTSLLNSAVESGSDRLSTWWAQRRRHDPMDAVTSSPPADDTRARRGSWWWASTGVIAAGVISAFVDPGFGLNPGSGRVLLSILISFAVDVVLGWFLVIWLVRRVVPGAVHTFVFRPATLLVVGAAVVFTRVTGFEPGIVFGLVAGVAFGALAGRARVAKIALVSVGYAFGLALIAWFAYGLIGGGGGADADASFGDTLVRETLAAVAIGGIAALPVALFPVRGMVGHTIFTWNRWVWGAAYAVGLLSFFIVLMPMPFSWDDVGWELWAWIGVYLAYAAFAVAAWLLLTRPWKRDPEDAAASATAPDPRERKIP